MLELKGAAVGLGVRGVVATVCALGVHGGGDALRAEQGGGPSLKRLPRFVCHLSPLDLAFIDCVQAALEVAHARVPARARVVGVWKELAAFTGG
jgi:hypothetical protein